MYNGNWIHCHCSQLHSSSHIYVHAYPTWCSCVYEFQVQIVEVDTMYIFVCARIMHARGCRHRPMLEGAQSYSIAVVTDPSPGFPVCVQEGYGCRTAATHRFAVPVRLCCLQVSRIQDVKSWLYQINCTSQLVAASAHAGPKGRLTCTQVLCNGSIPMQRLKKWYQCRTSCQCECLSALHLSGVQCRCRLLSLIRRQINISLEADVVGKQTCKQTD